MSSAKTPKQAKDSSLARPSAPQERFDEAYFRRYYEDPATRVLGPEEIAFLVNGVLSFAAYWHIPILSALDIGAGAAFWKAPLTRALPALRYRGVDLSRAACEKYGHEERNIATWRDPDRFDLIICQGVLQYLDDNDAEAALENIGAMADGLLYLEVLTKHDVAKVADKSRSDVDVHVRDGSWYRKRLARHFVSVGCGLHYARRGDALFFELETCG